MSNVQNLINKAFHEHFPQLLSLENNYVCLPKGLIGVLVSGANATPFLQGQFTCDITQLKPQQAQLGAYCDYKGRVLANFWIWSQDQDFIILLPKSMQTPFCEQLKKYALLSKVIITPDLNYGAALFLAPKHAPEINITEASIRYHSSLIQNLPNHSLIWLMGPEEAIVKLTSTLPSQTHWIDSTLGELLTILTGFSFIHPETSLLFTPQMINLHLLNAVSFRKGCYVGQEVISRTQHLGKLKRHLYAGIIKHSSTVPLAAELKNPEGDVVGIIFSAVKIQDDHYILAVLQDQALDQVIEFNQTPVKIYYL